MDIEAVGKAERHSASEVRRYHFLIILSLLFVVDKDHDKIGFFLSPRRIKDLKPVLPGALGASWSPS
jgi:hypothetical protein